MNKQTKNFRKDPKKFMIGHSWNHVVSNWYLIGIFLTWWEAGLSNSSSKVIQSLNITRAASKWLGTSSFIVTGILSSNITFRDTVRWKQTSKMSTTVISIRSYHSWYKFQLSDAYLGPLAPTSLINPFLHPTATPSAGWGPNLPKVKFTSQK